MNERPKIELHGSYTFEEENKEYRSHRILLESYCDYIEDDKEKVEAIKRWQGELIKELKEAMFEAHLNHAMIMHPSFTKHIEDYINKH